MITRRAFIGTVAGGVLAAPLVAGAQQTGALYRIAFLANDSPLTTMCVPNPSDVSFRALRDGLRELGYMEGVQITIDCRSAEGNYNRLPELTRELIQANPHVIVAAAAPASLAAKAATATLPIVSVYTADPVGLGLVSSLARPGGNVTGVSALASDYVAKSLQLLKETAPRATRIGVLGHGPNPTFDIYRRELETAGAALGLRLQFREMVSAVDIESDVAALVGKGVSAVLIMHQPFTFANRGRLVEALGKWRLPAMFGSREAIKAGGLISYAVSVSEVFRRAAVYVDKILKGAKPADLPIEQPTKFELVINLKTAKALGLTIPPSLLLRADQVIE
jgi:putative ABC transport system substrate-binding protein